MVDPHLHVPPSWQQPIASQSRKRCYRDGDVLFHEGDPSDGLYVLLSGRLKVYAAGRNGDEVVYNVLAPGELLGEVSLFGGPRTASVRAIGAVECLVLRNSVAQDLMRTRPEFAAHVFAKLASRIRHSTRMTRSLALDGVPERVCALLEACAVHDGHALRVPAELTQQEIANRIGASREMVLKVIGKLVAQGVLHKDARHRMTILKPLAAAGESRL
jgi:CRP/FNR family cyclic AMP-dependent transcriptional regulator